VHLCEDGSLLELKHVAFRDCLRTDAQMREQYAALKRHLAWLHGGITHEERQRYSDDKSEFVRSALAVPTFLEQFSRWAAGRPEITAAALIGSHSRGTATPSSDIDLVILCDTPEDLLVGEWPKTFGEVESRAIEDYGALRSLRVHYRGGLEVEFGFALPTWAVVPLDAGTRAVLADGSCILHDPKRVLQAARRLALATNRPSGIPKADP
jgi:predicted nucleotidyltransferase